jgi:hypothetical protein
VVIATDVFDRFLQDNGLADVVGEQIDDDELMRRFVDAKRFPNDVVEKLKDFLRVMDGPLAVRSSSLLEDSQYQPFAGVYQTYMIPNNNADENVRLEELLESIKLVYASTYCCRAHDYIKATPYHLEEEKMAVIIQRMIGSQHEERFYPDFAGVAKSYNFYPVSPQKAEDGIVQVALGLGYTVVEGGNSVRFCPKYPRHVMQFSSLNDTIRNAQQDFLALDVTVSFSHENHETPDVLLKHYDVDTAERDRTLDPVGSTYSAEDDAIYDGIARTGKRIVTFAPVLKQRTFPLPEIADLILEIGTWGMGTHVEVEFAADMNVRNGGSKEFALLQIRPMMLSREAETTAIESHPKASLVCKSRQVMGNGVIEDVYDLIVVDAEQFERSKSKQTAQDVARLNTKLQNIKRPYILIGVGRWGSLDPWLGIPVTWDQISGAAVIVESGFKDIDVTPSQGSHFFQNITSFRVGYFTVNSSDEESFLDWDWLKQQPAAETLEHARHLHFLKPVIANINGQANYGVILKP